MNITTNFTPYGAQTRILGGILNKPAKHHVISSSRQCGKSLMILNLAFKFTLETPNVMTGVVSPVFPQAKKLYLEMLKSLGDSAVMIVKSNNAQDLIINFKNGSTMSFFSGEAYNSLRGNTFDYLLCDEHAYQRENLWSEILKPATLVKGKKICFFSTPRGKNHFKDLFDIGLDPEWKDWSSYTIKTNENPYIDPEEIRMARKLLPANIFASEYLGEFTDSGSSVFEGIEAISTITKFQKEPEDGVKYKAGLDLAIADDYTVLTIMDDKGNVVDYFRERQTSWEQIIGKVTEKILHWRCSTYVELNNIGSVIFEQLRSAVGSLVQPFTTTNKTKGDAIENLKLQIAEEKIRIPTENLWPELHNEIQTFGYKILPSGLLSYKGISGAHDDIIMSLALCVSNWSKNSGKPKFSFPSSKPSFAK